MKGKIFGVGVGPGDPELLTLKALRVIGDCDVIAVPGEKPEDSTAFRIVKNACPELRAKTLLGIRMPMTKEKEDLRKSHVEAVQCLCRYLDEGKNIAFLTLGDPTVYSTYMYVHQGICSLGYEAEIISGVPSFCAAAAKLETEIARKEEQIHIIPASYPAEDTMSLPGTKIFMKSGRRMPDIIKNVKECGQDVSMVVNCGMEDERVYRSAAELPEDAGYFAIMFMKEKGDRV